MKKSLVALALLTLLATFAAAPALADVQDIISRGELLVGCQTTGATFSFVDKNGVRTGFAVELAQKIAEAMGVKVKLVDYDWSGLIPALLANKVDLIAADMTATPARALKVSFTQPFYVTGSSVVVLDKSPIKTMEQCNDAKWKIGVLLGSTGEIMAKKYFPKAEIKSFKGSGTLILDAVSAGRVDAGVNDRTAIFGQVIRTEPGTFRVLDGTLSKEPLSFAVRPQDTHLLAWLNLYFDWIKADGTMDGLIKYWIESDQAAKDH